MTKETDFLADLEVNYADLITQYDEYSISVPINEYLMTTFNEKISKVQLRLLVNYKEYEYDKDTGEQKEVTPKSIELKVELDDKLELIDPSNDKVEEEKADTSAWG